MQRAHTLSLICSISCMLYACGQPEQDDSPDMPDTVRADMSSRDMNTAQDMPDTGSADEPDQPAASDLGVDSGADTPDMTTSSPEVPSSAAELFTYLQEMSYTSLPAEPAVHASTGPHGRVRTFVNPTLADSIEAQATSHPVGSASVKELYSSSDQLTGWAVSVKLTDTEGDGNDWYWYEVFSTTQNNPVVDGTGAGGCTGCHSGGTDFILTPGPFVR